MFDFFFSRSRLDELRIKRLMCTRKYLHGVARRENIYAAVCYCLIYIDIYVYILCLFNNVYKLKVYKFRHYKTNRCTVMILARGLLKQITGRVDLPLR